MPACGGRCPIAHYCLDLGHDDGDDDDSDDDDDDSDDDVFLLECEGRSQ